jgi:hypothetical protein
MRGSDCPTHRFPRRSSVAALLSASIAQGDAWHELHHQEVRVALGVEVEDGCDVGVSQRRQS